MSLPHRRLHRRRPPRHLPRPPPAYARPGAVGGRRRGRRPDGRLDPSRWRHPDRASPRPRHPRILSAASPTPAPSSVRSPPPSPPPRASSSAWPPGLGWPPSSPGTLWNWQEVRPPGTRRPLVALFPTFGLFCYTALLSSDIDRVDGGHPLPGGCPLFLTVADRPALSRRPPPATADRAPRRRWPWRPPPSSSPWPPLPGSPACSLDAIPFAQGGAKRGGPGGPGTGIGDVGGIGALNLIDNMRAVLTTRAHLLMFSAIPAHPPTGRWRSSPTSTAHPGSPITATKAAAQLAPQLTPVTLPVLPEPTATHDLHREHRHRQSPLHPPAGASGDGLVGDANSVQVEPGIGVIQPFAAPETSPSTPPPACPPPSGPRPRPPWPTSTPSVPAADLAPYLPCRLVLPSDVVRWPTRSWPTRRGPEAEAEALVRYFTVAKRFRYTLTRPRAGTTNALSSFLFSTRAGFCQQFAGAFAVLARLDGLPTRLAIGFTTGATSDRTPTPSPGPTPTPGPRSTWAPPPAGCPSSPPRPPPTRPTGAGVSERYPHDHGATPPVVCHSDHHLRQASPGPEGDPAGGRAQGTRMPPAATRRRRPPRLVGHGRPVALAAVAVLVAGSGRDPGSGAAAALACAAAPSPAATGPGDPRSWPAGSRRRRSSPAPVSAAGSPRPSRSTPPGWPSRPATHPGGGVRLHRPPGTAVNPDAHAARALEPPTGPWPSWPPGPATRPTPAPRRTSEARRLSDALRVALRRGAPVGDRAAAEPLGSRPPCADASISTPPRPSWPGSSRSSSPKASIPRAPPVGTSLRPAASTPSPSSIPSPTNGERSGDTIRVLDQFRWGLVPHWAKDVRKGNKMINARAETVAKTPAYRSAFAAHRCLIIVDGFYEWYVPEPAGCEDQGPLLLPPRRRPPPHFRRSLRDLVGQVTLGRTRTRSRDPPAHLHHHHHRGRSRHGRGPQPHACHLGARRYDDWLDPDNRDTDACAVSCAPPRPAPCCSTRLHRGQQSPQRRSRIAPGGGVLLSPIPSQLALLGAD